MLPAWPITRPSGQVHTHSLDGRKVIFPAEALRRVVTRDGVHGRFRLTFTDAGRFIAIQRLSR
ncbi:DUF2835 family protein [Halomonas sp. BC04]|uniref:DUF2835 family protein n=1 Tax=Halomonas sp. BC04 TaxID=1403540 RepID=UPI0003ED8870|nr:hypothetical protein Q427_01010 [Halomonas sp. BC04]